MHAAVIKRSPAVERIARLLTKDEMDSARRCCPLLGLSGPRSEVGFGSDGLGNRSIGSLVWFFVVSRFGWSVFVLVLGWVGCVSEMFAFGDVGLIGSGRFYRWGWFG